MNDPYIIVLGDFLRDVYITKKLIGKYWETVEQLEYPGGASATYEYVKKLGGQLSPSASLIKTLEYSLTNTQIKLIRTKYETDSKDFKTYNTLEYPKDFEFKIKEYTNNISTLALIDGFGKEFILVISDYNKTSLKELSINPFFKQMINRRNPFALVVDSRYRTFDPDPYPTPIKIWHATGNEYDKNYARRFKYTIHTNGAYPVKIKNASSSVLAIVDVPDVQVISSVGAGDCFTASIATYLSKLNKEPTQSELVDMVKFAITNCLEVVQTPYTKIPQYLIPINQWRS